MNSGPLVVGDKKEGKSCGWRGKGELVIVWGVTGRETRALS